MSKRQPRSNPNPRAKVISPTVSSSKLPVIVTVATAGIAVVLAVALRVWASLDDFWLDEIWSWTIATQLKNPLDVVMGVHHDNNHYLNTLVLYGLGGNAPVFLYRLPAVVAGIGTVLLCGLAAGRWSHVAAVSAMMITSCSFLLIQYSSEARGYAYLLFFVMASFVVIQQSNARPRLLWDVLFACFAVLGFLSHLTYAFAYIALVSWSLWSRITRNGWLSRRHVPPIIFQVLVPGGFLAFLYLVDLRYIQVGGGDENSVWKVIAQATSAAFGGPLEGTATVGISVAVYVAAVFAIVLLYRSGSDLWLPLVVGIFIVPVLILLVARPQWPYPRYFLVSMLFLQLLVSWLLAWIYQQPFGKAAYLLILAAILGGNAVLISRLLEYGRGDYQAAVQFMLDHTANEQVLVGSDHDFRNKMVLAFYFARTGGDNRVGYFDYGQWPPEGPEWIVLHDFSQQFALAKSASDDRGNKYELARVFPYAGLSGFNWALYHNTNRPTNSLDTATPGL